MDHRQIIKDALIHHGFTASGADALIAAYDGWQVDLAKHAISESFKRYAGRLLAPAVLPHLSALINSLDPFEPNGSGWRRKSTGEPVPAALLTRQEKQDHGI